MRSAAAIGIWFLCGCYGSGELVPVLLDVCDGRLVTGSATVTDVGNVGSDVAEAIGFGESIVVDLDNVPTDMVRATPSNDGGLELDAVRSGVGYLKVRLDVPDGVPSWAWFLLDVRDAPSANPGCWTETCRRTYSADRWY